VPDDGCNRSALVRMPLLIAQATTGALTDRDESSRPFPLRARKPSLRPLKVSEARDPPGRGAAHAADPAFRVSLQGPVVGLWQNQETNMPTKKPAFYAYTVRENGDDRYWSRIGAAWACKGGFTIQLDALPVSGKIVLQEPKKDDTKGDENIPY
jgi:hypothetical protein